MLYLEELSPGDTFRTQDGIMYILTCDFKQNKTHSSNLVISLTTGNPLWLKNSTVVYAEPIFYINTDKDIVPIKETKKCTTK
jgi:hypothetical protein